MTMRGYMFTQLVQKVFGSANDRFVKKLDGPVEKINDLEPQFESLSDQELQAKTTEFKS